MKLAIKGGSPVRSKPFPQWPIWDAHEQHNLQDVLKSGKWGSAHGEQTRTFESEFAIYQDAKYGVTTTSGTTALEVAIRTAGVMAGDEVIVPAYTFIASAIAILNNGAVPVFADIDPVTYNIDSQKIEAFITERTRAIMPVHFAGRPADMDANTPATWSQLNFGWYVSRLPGALVPDGVTTIRQGVDGAEVPDAHVGGHGNCGEGLDHWTEWGEANYPGETQINIQNQWNIADYPCFSTYFITFPLDAIPAGTQVVSATVTLYLFGNAGYEPGDAQPSAIQALTIDEDWDEQTLTWNNAPRARENIALTWVEPVDGFDPGVPYRWDVSDAAAVAFGAGEPLRLAFYSADGEYHSGKYFWSSDAAEAVRPRLDVAWRHAPEDAAPGDEGVFLPLLAPP